MAFGRRHSKLAQLKVSIVIATYNRWKKLNRLLRSVVESSIPFECEVIIVDDSDGETMIDERTMRVMDSRLQILRNRSRVFFTKARNLGWKKAKGQYIFFIDDDNILPEATIERLVKELDHRPEIGALMPVVYYAGRRDIVWVYATPFAEGKWGFNLLGRNTVELRKPKAELLQTDALPNAFMVRRNIVEQIGGFDESLYMSSSCDFCQRIKLAGYETCAITTIPTYHDVSLPRTPGYWAEHATQDPARRYHDVRDWFTLMRRLHAREKFLLPKEFVRSLPFILASTVGVLLHPSKDKRILAIYSSIFRGVVDGMRAISAS